MHGQQAAVFHEALHCSECTFEVTGIFHSGGIGTDGVEGLGESRTSEPQGVGREIDIIEFGVFAFLQHRANGVAHVGGLSSGGNNHSAGSINLFVAIFLCHRQRVFAGGDIDAKGTGKVAACLHGFVKGCVFTCILAWPHPVGAEAYALQTIFQMCAGDVCKGFRHCNHRTFGGISKGYLRSMAYGSGDTRAAGVVECHNTAVAQRKLYFTLALLSGDASGHRAVDLVCEPVFAGNGFERKHIAHIFVNF